MTFARVPVAALVAYAVLMLLALYTHYYALFLLAAQNAYVLWLAHRGALAPGAPLVASSGGLRAGFHRPGCRSWRNREAWPHPCRRLGRAGSRSARSAD